MLMLMEFCIFRITSFWFMKFTTHTYIPLALFESRAATVRRVLEEPPKGNIPGYPVESSLG